MDAPLVDRPDAAALFLRPDRAIDARALLADAHVLAARVGPGGHLIDLCRDRYGFVVAFLAAQIAGRVCLLPPDPSPAALAALVASYPDCLAATDDRLEAPCPIVVVTVGHAGPAPNPVLPAGRLAAIAFTSGSTGSPVAHRKSWGALVARSRAAGAQFGLSEAAPAAILGTVPPHHMYGFETTALLPLHAPCVSWCGPAFFPADVAAALARLPAPRLLVTTPLQLRALEAIAPPALAAVISATAPLDPALAAEIEARWQTQVLEIFGATECGSIASRRTARDVAWSLYPGIVLRQQAEASVVAGPFMADVPLADELTLEADGRFRLLGRRADMVKLGGRRASLAGLNRILTGLDGVIDGAFVVPDDLERRSSARLLVLVVAPGRTGADILAELRGRIDPVFLPRRVIHVPELPRNDLGKLPRQAVLDLLARS